MYSLCSNLFSICEMPCFSFSELDDDLLGEDLLTGKKVTSKPLKYTCKALGMYQYKMLVICCLPL